jgi:hypothetical protein
MSTACTGRANVPDYAQAAAALLRLAQPFFDSYSSCLKGFEDYENWLDLRRFAETLISRRAMQLNRVEMEELHRLLPSCLCGPDVEFLLAHSFNDLSERG